MFSVIMRDLFHLENAYDQFLVEAIGPCPDIFDTRHRRYCRCRCMTATVWSEGCISGYIRYRKHIVYTSKDVVYGVLYR